MTIRVYENRIDFGNYSLIVDNIGISVRAANSNTFGTLTAASLEALNYPFQGTVAGFTSGGWLPPASNVIDRFPFANVVTNAYDHGDLSVARIHTGFHSSSEYGYTSGGYTAPGASSNVIDKFPFAISSNAVDVADITIAKFGVSGHSSNTHGYLSAGYTPAALTAIEKFLFASDTNATSVGNVTQARYYGTGHSSGTHGYTVGGLSSNVIDKFPFAVDANSTDVGDILSATDYQISAGISSQHHGYVAGGGYPAGNSNVIQRFSFITNQNSVDIADLTAGRHGAAGVSSTVEGFVTGGATAPFTVQNIIDKFPFAASSGDYLSRDVGDLTQSRAYMYGQQD